MSKVRKRSVISERSEYSRSNRSNRSSRSPSYRGNNFSRNSSTAGSESEYRRTIHSVGNGVDNNARNSTKSIFSATSTSSRPKSKPIEVDYDTDDNGLFRAKKANEVTKDAKVILDSTVTKINTPLDLMSTQQIDVEELGNNRVRKFRID